MRRCEARLDRATDVDICRAQPPAYPPAGRRTGLPVSKPEGLQPTRTACASVVTLSAVDVTLSGQAVSQWGFLVEYELLVDMLYLNQDR